MQQRLLPGSLTYRVGDATSPTESGYKIITHVTNLVGGWGAGFVLAISKKWPQPEREYRNLFTSFSQKAPALGLTQFVEVEPDITIANMLAQKFLGIRINKNNLKQIPLDYPALEICMKSVAKEAIKRNAIIVAPRFGAGLAGGDFSIIEKMIKKIWCDAGINVTIYDLA